MTKNKENLLDNLKELWIIWIHNSTDIQTSNLLESKNIDFYESLEFNFDQTLKLSQIRDITMLLYKEDNIAEEAINEDLEKYNDYIKQLGDINIKVIFDIWIYIENDWYNLENTPQLNSIRVYDDNINKNIPSDLIYYIKTCWFGRNFLTDINHVLDWDYNELYKIIKKSLWNIIEEQYNPVEIVFNHGQQRILLFIPRNIYNKNIAEKLELEIREEVNGRY